jgi:cyclopropane fatty-acyl-phospholipid synthase-like methyltransferase
MKTLKSKQKKAPAFDRYSLYSQAVQSPEGDVKFYRKIYKEIRKGKEARVLREDFCAAGAISCEWVKLDPKNTSCGLDLDQEPMNYGREHYIAKMNSDQQKRIALIKKDVLTPNLPSADIAVAVNFSYFFFKKREILKKYFENVYKSLNSNGLFVIDVFGGTQCTDAIEDKTKHKDFTYYWDQKSFDPVTNEAYFEIHFKYKNKKHEAAFSYDWRMWSIPELKEIMLEAGFQDTKVYWEGTAKNGSGNGKFTAVQKGESCLSWIAYIAGIK